MTIADRIGHGKRLDTASNEDAGILSAPRKSILRDAILLAVLVLSSTGSFGLGVLAGREGGEGKRIDIERAVEAAPAAVHAPVEAPEEGMPPPEPKPATAGEYVASKSGTKYYLPWCGTAKRIKEENKVWFPSKQAAEAAGYEPAKNCKGL